MSLLQWYPQILFVTGLTKIMEFYIDLESFNAFPLWTCMTTMFSHYLKNDKHFHFKFPLNQNYMKSMKAKLMEVFLAPLEFKEIFSYSTYMLFYPHLYGKQTLWHCPPWPWSRWDLAGHLPPDTGQIQTGSWTNTPWLQAHWNWKESVCHVVV